MSHTCLDCGWWTMDNKPRGPFFCPSCSSDNIRDYFDEDPREYMDDDDDDEKDE